MKEEEEEVEERMGMIEEDRHKDSIVITCGFRQSTLSCSPRRNPLDDVIPNNGTVATWEDENKIHYQQEKILYFILLYIIHLDPLQLISNSISPNDLKGWIGCLLYGIGYFCSMI